ncbi:MAG: prolyl oligopeptidase family serine peptidase [Alphaproteobacteria bacterium]|nr:prolyl oligopeptidase family serine peptidase [Alphaproteobacteria bacterium]
MKKKPGKSLRPDFSKSSNDNGTPEALTKEGLKRALNPPNDGTKDVLHGVTVPDPFRPLEDLDAAETTAWVDRQNDKFAKYIAGQQETIDKTTEFLTEAMDYSRSSLPSRYGQNYFSTFQDGLAPQSIYQVSDSEDGTPRTLIDPNTLSTDGTVSLSGVFPSPDGTRVAYLTSKAGSDMQTLKIRDVATGKDLPDVIEGCRFAEVLWDKDSNESFQYTYPVTPGSWGRKTMHHNVGDDADNDTLVFEHTGGAPWAEPTRLRTGKNEWISTGNGFDPNNGLHYRPLGSDDAFTALQQPFDCVLKPVAEFDNGDILALTTKDAERGRLVRFNLADPAPENWQTVIPEDAADPLGNVLFHQGKLFAFYSHDTADAVKVFEVDGTHLHDMPLPLQSVAGYARINKEDTSFLMKISGFLSAGDTYRYDIDTNKLDFVKKSDAKFDLDGCIVERIYATSKDGTQVPMTVIRKPETKLDGTAAVKLYGYGASNVALGPRFANTITDWVKNGGIYVQANLRGGGEFGAEWYDGGRMDNKKNVFDDFIACAEKLIADDYASTPRLVIEGGSAGGLLTAVCANMRPDLFGAVISAVPVTDVYRLHMTRGAQAVPEYGDPAVKEDFEKISEYSALHNVKPGVKRPPHLIKTGDHDTRVPPWHAYKLAATIQALAPAGSEILLRVDKDAGHGAGKSTQKVIQEAAETMAFIEKAIGPVNQLAYKAKLAQDKAKQKKPKKGKDKKFGG